MASVLAWTHGHPGARSRVCLTSRHVLGAGEDERAPQEEVEVEGVGHLVGSHQ